MFILGETQHLVVEHVERIYSARCDLELIGHHTPFMHLPLLKLTHILQNWFIFCHSCHILSPMYAYINYQTETKDKNKIN